MAYTRGVQSDRIDLEQHGAAWLERLHELVTAQARDSHLFPSAVNVTFESLFGKGTTGTMDVLTSVFQSAAFSVEPGSMAAVRELVVAEQGGGSRTKFQYDLRAFGLDEGRARAAFS